MNQQEIDEGECTFQEMPLTELQEYVSTHEPLSIEAGPMKTIWYYSSFRLEVIVRKNGSVWACSHNVPWEGQKS